MITVIVTVIVLDILLAVILGVAGREFGETSMVVGFCLGIPIGLFLAIWIGFCVPTVQTTTSQPMVSIYTNQNQDEIYLKAISRSGFLYRVMDNGVPRDQTVWTNSVQSVVIEDVSPYVETTKFYFKEKWYKYFAFSAMHDVVVFHLPQSGIEADINAFLK